LTSIPWSAYPRWQL